ncbi:MAG: M20/M25/M40 family metallo-hydrolase [Phycisphaeraceae bacterium]|nr:M20/M25/M40 family metallo-hydrolase [Phycisphaeraceae bacterium]
MNKTFQKWLLQITGLPTAPGKEEAVMAWVRAWARKRRDVVLELDPYGNMMLSRRGARGKGQTVVIEAHLDHPAFVCREVVAGNRLSADFRGGVESRYFRGTKVRLRRGKGFGGVVDRISLEKKEWHEDRQVEIRFDKNVPAEPGDMLTWDLPAPRIGRDGMLRTPVCDNLAGVAAALAALEIIRKDPRKADVRVVLSRAEEIGFVGAIAVCKERWLAKNTRVIVLENSRCLPDAPVGAGPIVRVGDRANVFDPAVTAILGAVATRLTKQDKDFRWQRKLMTGGTCNASAYGAYGYAAGCLCVPLANYHNMNEKTGRIDSECISVADWQGLVTLLAESALTLAQNGEKLGFLKHLEDIFAVRKQLIAGFRV